VAATPTRSKVTSVQRCCPALTRLPDSFVVLSLWTVVQTGPSAAQILGPPLFSAQVILPTQFSLQEQKGCRPAKEG